MNASGTLYALKTAANSQLHTGNAGWTTLSTAVAGTTTAPVSSLFMKASNVLVVGNTGTILEHTGTAFTDNSAKTAPLQLRDIFAVPTTATATTNTAYAVGNDGTVIRTTDGGTTWQTLNSGTAAQLNAVAFANTTDGVIVGNGGTTLKSTSTGISLQASGTNSHLNDVAYNSTATRYSAAGQNRTIVQSTNGGTSYTTMGITGNSTETLNGIADIGSTVHILGTAGYTTKNTSGSWYANYKMPYTLNALHIHKTNGLGMIVGNNSTTLNTTNKGYTWWLNKPIAKTTTTMYNFTGVAIHSQTAIYATALASIPMRIDNMQATTRTNLTGTSITSQDWNDVAIANNGKGYIGGAANKHAYFTAPATACTIGVNTGAPGTYVVNSISVGVNKVFFACNGGLLFSKDIATNANTTLTTGVSANLLKVSMYDDLNGILMGASGTMLRMYDNNGNPLFENKTTLNNNGTAVTTAIQAADYASRNHVVFGGAAGHIKNLETEKQYTSLFWYDKLGRMVVSQNTKQYNKTTKAYSYTQYDALGRITEVGEIAQAASINNQYVNKQLSDALFTTWVTGGTRTEVTQTYYDEQFAAGGTLTQTNLRKRVASVTYEDVYDNNVTTYQSATHYTYDIHGNVNRMAQEIRETRLLATGLNIKYVDYDYDLVSGKVNKVCYNAGSKDQYYHKYDYDGDNRITKVWTSKDNIWWDNDAKYNYYNHGPLARTVIGDLEVQGMDYAYTLHGWLKGVNSNTLQADRDMGKDGMPASPRQYVAKDAMGYTLGYYAGDYTGIKAYPPLQQFEAATTGSDLMAARQDLFNGNISHMETALPQVAAYNATRTITPSIRGGAYKYDQLNRLIEARSFFNVSIAGNGWQSGGGTPMDYYENFGYDAMGNITNVQRWGNGGVQMDNMTYRYNTKTSGGDLISNKLYGVNDATAAGNYTDDIDDQGAFTNAQDATVNTLNNYGYDELGNLKRDNAEQIANIEWTVYGKIKKVTRTAPSTKPDLEFIYDAGGNRICKIVKPKPLNVASYKYSYYLRDAQGNVMANYQHYTNDANQAMLVATEHNLYGSSRLGVEYRIDTLYKNTVYNPAWYSNNKCVRNLGLKSYELSNHLGNVLATVSDKKVYTIVGANIVFEPEITTISDYYPFGSSISTRSYSSGAYRYGFNGKEQDEESFNDAYDFGARIYDGRLGRWLSLDAHYYKYPYNSPFVFCNNSTLIIIDDNGKDGKLTGSGTKEDPYIITASYAYIENNITTLMVDGLKAAVNEYNKEGGSVYKNKEGIDVFVKYKLNVVPCKDAAGLQAEQAKSIYKFTATDGTEKSSINTVENMVGCGETPNALGCASGNKTIGYIGSAVIQIMNDMTEKYKKNTGDKLVGCTPDFISVLKSAMIHEIFHNLGGNHGDAIGGVSVSEMDNTTIGYSEGVGNGADCIHYCELTSESLVSQQGTQVLTQKSLGTTTPNTSTTTPTNGSVYKVKPAVAPTTPITPTE